MAPSITSSNSPANSGSYGSARIMCRQADGAVALVRVCQSLAEALAESNLLIDRHLVRLKTNRQLDVANPARPREIYVERWVGTETSGHWAEVQRGDFTGLVYGRMNAEYKLELITPRLRFEFLDQAPRLNRGKNDEVHAFVDYHGAAPAKGMAIDGSTLHKAAYVVCILTGRTKKNGWFARLEYGSASGPITNADQMPAEFEVGHSVTLRLNGINLDKQFASFRWEGQLD